MVTVETAISTSTEGEREFFSVDPATGQTFGPAFVDATDAEVSDACEIAWQRHSEGALSDVGVRISLLRAIAEGLRQETDSLAELADRETGLGVGRLRGEVERTWRQLAGFAQLLESQPQRGEIDDLHALAGATKVQLRRKLVPLGPVAVFSASNFPFAFSVAGGDTAAALAAGCPVVCKAHPSHPATSALTARVIRDACRSTSVPEDVVQVIQGHRPGVSNAVVLHGRIRAVAFTGSYTAGSALYRLAATRPAPIPVYAEMSSVNPAVLLPIAAAERADQVVAGWIDSLTLGSGQFCTKPGILLVPGSSSQDSVRTAGTAAATRTDLTLLNRNIASALVTDLTRASAIPGLDAVVAGGAQLDTGYHADAAIFCTSIAEASEQDWARIEHFGPVGVIVVYDDVSEVCDFIAGLDGQLAVSIHSAVSDAEAAERLIPYVERVAGRIVWNGWPTGVAVSAAMVHTGPWPASSNSLYTSVGYTSIGRFERPVVHQTPPGEIHSRAPRATDS